MKDRGTDTGIRAKQRRHRENAIIRAALRLVSEKGYRMTSIEEIAAAAEVGPATVYNYFGSKADLLLAALNREMVALLKHGEHAIKDPPAGAAAAILALLRAYFEPFARQHDKQLLREFFAVGFLEQVSVREKIMALDYRLMGQIGQLLNLLRDRGDLRADADTNDMSMVLYAITGMDFIAFAMFDPMTPDEFLAAMGNHIELVCRGFTPPAGKEV